MNRQENDFVSSIRDLKVALLMQPTSFNDLMAIVDAGEVNRLSQPG
jgi:hypothetical protein